MCIVKLYMLMVSESYMYMDKRDRTRLDKTVISYVAILILLVLDILFGDIWLLLN